MKPYLNHIFLLPVVFRLGSTAARDGGGAKEDGRDLSGVRRVRGR